MKNVSRQEEILFEIAEKHGISKKDAREVWASFIRTTKEIISEPDKLVDGKYDPEKFKVIHIDNFGKFVPNQRNIRFANKCLETKNKNNE